MRNVLRDICLHNRMPLLRNGSKVYIRMLDMFPRDFTTVSLYLPRFFLLALNNKWPSGTKLSFKSCTYAQHVLLLRKAFILILNLILKYLNKLFKNNVTYFFNF